MSDQTTEQAIQAAGADKAPRITPADLKANIAHTEIVEHITHSGQVLRWAVLTTHSGYAVVGRPSVSVSPENDRPQIGIQVAIENSKNELWPLMGYELKSRLAEAAAAKAAPTDFRDRVRAEAAELQGRIDKLASFLPSDTFNGLPKEEQGRLTAQLAAMQDYSNCLAERISAFQ